MPVNSERHRPPRQVKTALVLSGGGITGAMYEIGCLTAFDDFFEDSFSSLEFDIYVGTSAGAVVASLLANRIRPRLIFDSIIQNRDTEFNFRRQDIFCPCSAEVRKFLGRTLQTLPGAFQFYWKNREQMYTTDFLHVLLERLPVGLLKLDPLQATLRNIFARHGASDDFRGLPQELYLIATDLDSGEREVFGELDWSHVPVSLAAAASSAIPVFFEPIRIEGRDFVDGSVGQVAHLDVAIEHGADFILVVNPITHVVNDGKKVCFTTHDGRCGRMRDMGLTFVADQAGRIQHHVRMQMGLRRFQSENPHVMLHLLEPDLDEGFMFHQGYMSFVSRVETLKYGYQSAMKKLRTLRHPVESLRRRPARVVPMKHRFGKTHREIE